LRSSIERVPLRRGLGKDARLAVEELAECFSIRPGRPLDPVDVVAQTSVMLGTRLHLVYAGTHPEIYSGNLIGFTPNVPSFVALDMRLREAGELAAFVAAHECAHPLLGHEPRATPVRIPASVLIDAVPALNPRYVMHVLGSRCGGRDPKEMACEYFATILRRRASPPPAPRRVKVDLGLPGLISSVGGDE